MIEFFFFSLVDISSSTGEQGAEETEDSTLTLSGEHFSVVKIKEEQEDPMSGKKAKQ